jgi:putative membrane protein
MKKSYVIILSLAIIALLPGCVDKDDTDKKNPRQQLNIVADPDDAKFIVDADLFLNGEIELGKLAVTKGADKRIKNFGAMMVNDYIKLDTKLITLAHAKKITLLDAPGEFKNQHIDSLSKMQGAEFDQAYIKYMVGEHRQAIDVFVDAGKHRFDKDIKKFARRSALNLMRHLDAIDAIRDSKN